MSKCMDQNSACLNQDQPDELIALKKKCREYHTHRFVIFDRHILHMPAQRYCVPVEDPLCESKTAITQLHYQDASVIAVTKAHRRSSPGAQVASVNNRMMRLARMTKKRVACYQTGSGQSVYQANPGSDNFIMQKASGACTPDALHLCEPIFYY